MARTRSEWDPALYARFADERARPVHDLLARVTLEAPSRIVDLGCGAGASTTPLVARWPQADVLGIDTSKTMLEQARLKEPHARFALADVSTWTPETPVDLLFSNATLQWVPDHATLLPRLMSLLAPGGVLAVQMPDNLDEPSHALMREIAALPAFADKLRAAAAARTALDSFETTYDLLAPQARTIDIWKTVYVHALPGARKIIEMVSSTGLRPYLDPLDADEQAAFLHLYENALARAYPLTLDGRALLRFPRRFFVVTKR